jgi:hypothetical protein
MYSMSPASTPIIRTRDECDTRSGTGVNGEFLLSRANRIDSA